MNTAPLTQTESAVLSEINITPFTDVLLVLLIIFMILAAMLVPPGFERQMAPPGTAPAKSVSRIAVSIDRHGDVRFNGAPVSVQGLYAEMARAGASSHVSLYADTHSPYGVALRVLDAAKDAGIRDVAFVTQ